ncbi:MAG: response regulator [Lachnospiraceae bacterium]|nr:response regulator [Lachnospiraceae bacterium]
MWKVAIIDDEPIIVEGLSRSFPWEKWGCRVTATAENGEEGTELIRREKPDLLFSDICMPGLNGLNMIAGVKSEYPDMEIAILTGYRDFEYAREAIRLGVTRFLLKPSKMDEIQEAVQVMVGNLERKGIWPERQEPEHTPAAGEAADRKEQAESMEASGKGAEERDAGSFVVNNAISYIEENYQNKLKLEEVADHVFVSQWHLSKLLNRYRGQSFSDILNHVRIEKAKELLKDPGLRVGDVAELVGFLDMAHFSRVFKKVAGVTANEYRNTLS